MIFRRLVHFSEPDVKKDSYGAFVERAYEAVFRRPADERGRQAYTRLMKTGLSPTKLLEAFICSDEFRNRALTDKSPLAGADDQYETDPAVSRFLNVQVKALSHALRNDRYIPVEAFEEIAHASLQELAGVLGGQDQYLAFHGRRFLELANVIYGLSKSGLLPERPAILDFGFSVNSCVLRRLFKEAVVSVCDRPQIQCSTELGFETFSVDLTGDQLAETTFEKSFDLIIFSEVLEHLLANPVKIFRFVLKHLNPDGRMVLTTPNFFSRAKLLNLARRRNPQPIYPETYGQNDSPHFHVREYSLSELLELVDAAGGSTSAFFFSDCWDVPGTRGVIPDDQLENIVMVLENRHF